MATATSSGQALECPLCSSPLRDWFFKHGRRLVRCTSCRLVSVPEGVKFTDDGISIYESEDNIFLQDGNEAYYLDPTNLTSCAVKRDWIARYIPSGASLLDVGSNYGHFLEVARHCFTAVGFDLSPQAVRWSRDHFDVQNFTGSIHAPPQELRGPHDVVTCWDVIEHVPDPLGALESLHSMVRPGGHLFLSTPDAGSLVSRLMGRYWHYLDPEQHINLFTRANLSRALERLGFEVLECRSLGRYYRIQYIRDRLIHLHSSPVLRAGLKILTLGLWPFRSCSVYLKLGDVMGVAARRRD